MVNNSNTPKTFGKGKKIACATSAFEEHTAVYEDKFNLISSETCTQSPNTHDPLAVLCNQMAYLPPEQFHQATPLLFEYSDILSLSNAKIGRANVARFELDLAHDVPISTPLHRVPLHKQRC